MPFNLPNGFVNRPRIVFAKPKSGVSHPATVGTAVAPVTTPSQNRPPLPMPSLHPDELLPDGSPGYTTKVIDAPLHLEGGPKIEDVAQGRLENCGFGAAAGSIFTMTGGAEHLKNRVRANGDGTFTVTLFERNNKMKHVPVVEVVDGRFWVKPDGTLLYGRNGPDSGDVRLLFPLIEKAHAQRKGGYGKTTDENAAHAFETLLGRDATFENIRKHGEKRVWNTITSVMADNRPIVAGTSGTGNDFKVRDFYGKMITIYSEHQYSVMATGEENGHKYVLLRNAWGTVVRDGPGDTKGMFKLDFSTFKKSMASLAYVDAPRKSWVKTARRPRAPRSTSWVPKKD